MEEGKQYELFSGKKSISSGKIKFNQFPNLREKKLIEERKKVEEADNILTEELFFGKKP